MTQFLRGPDGKIASAATKLDTAVAEFYYDGGGDGDTALSLTTPTTAAIVTGWSLGKQNKDLRVDADDQIVIKRNGDRKVSFRFSEIGQVNSQVLVAAVFKNGTITRIRDKVTNEGTAIPVVLAMEGILEDLKVTDELEVRVSADTGDFTFKRGFFKSEEI